MLSAEQLKDTIRAIFDGQPAADAMDAVEQAAAERDLALAALCQIERHARSGSATVHAIALTALEKLGATCAN